MTPELALSIGVALVPYALGWVILVFKPRWTFLFAFTGAMMVFGLPAFIADGDPFRGAARLLIRGGVFMAVGGPIVGLRLWIDHVRAGAAYALTRNKGR